MAYYLQMDGVDDFLRSAPSLTVDKFVLDLELDATVGNFKGIIETNGGTTSNTVSTGSGNGNLGLAGFSASDIKVNGVTTVAFTKGTRFTLEANKPASVTSDANGFEFFSFNTGAGACKGKLYSIKGYLSGTLVFDYNMTLGNVQDQSGNGRHATLTGGTWVSDSTGTTHEAAASLQAVATVTSNAEVIPAAITGAASLQGVATLQATATVENAALTGAATIQAVGMLTATGTVVKTSGSNMIGASTLSAMAEGLTVLGAAALTTIAQITAAATSGRPIVGKIKLKGERTMKIRLKGSRETKIRLKGGLPVAKKNQNGELIAGDTKDIEITATDSNTGQPVNLSGATIKWALKKSLKGEQLVYKTTSDGITVTDAAKGVFEVRLDSEDTADLRAARYYHEAEITDSMGNVSTVTKGDITIEDSGV